MNQLSSACPYCNALLPPTATGPRSTCPTCGETVVQGGPPGNAITGAPPAGTATAITTAPPAPTAAPPAAPPRRLWPTLLVILGLMLTMAGLGLVFALRTQGERRANDAGITKKKRYKGLPGIDSAPPSGPEETPPGQLAALGYLPAKTNVVLGIHLAELRATPHGRQLLDLPLHVGPASVRLDRLGDWTGLGLDGIDHVVVGLGTDVGKLPRLSAIVRTTRGYDPAAVLRKLEARRLDDLDAKEKRTLYQVRFRDTSYEAVLWCADERTLVFGFLPGDVEAVPAEPVADLGQLPAGLRELLRDRMPTRGPLWAAGTVDWSRLGGAPWVAPLVSRWSAGNPKVPSAIQGIRAAGAVVLPGETTRVTALVRCADAERADQLREQLPRERLQEAGWKIEQKDAWLTLHGSISQDRLAGLLER